MILLGIDPGTDRSGWVLVDGDRILACGIDDNEAVADDIRHAAADRIVIERIEPRYGLRIGWETIASIEWVGRFTEAAGTIPVALVKRSEVLRHLGVSPKGNADSGVRAAMLDRWGGQAAARKGGALHGVRSHAWPALAVAVAFREGCAVSLLRDGGKAA